MAKRIRRICQIRFERTIKCVFAGDDAIRKTCAELMVTYQRGRPQEYVPAVFDNLDVTVMIGEEEYRLFFSDTAGQEHYDRVRRLSYSETDVFLVCFSIVVPTSLENVRKKWYPELAHHCPKTPIVLVGTQLELRDDTETLERLARHHQTPVTVKQGVQLQREIGAASYVECSARTQENLKTVFDEATRVALEIHTKPICPICKEVIKNSPRKSIFCEGECHTWIHKRCAGFSWLSKPSFKTVTSTDEPFHCPRCKTSMSSPEATHPKPCPICKIVIDSSQEAIFCKGECGTWLHKRCAGFRWFSKPSFKTVTSTDEPFHCPRCKMSMSSPEATRPKPWPICKNVINSSQEAISCKGECDTLLHKRSSPEATRPKPCPICKNVINSSQEAIFCKGECDTLLHKRCAGFSWFSKPSFKTVTSTDEPFYCPRCKKSESPTKCSKASTHVPVLDRKPDIATLQCFKCTDAQGETQRVFIIDELAAKWDRIGASLKFPTTKLDNIAADHHGVEACAKRMLALWLQGHVRDISQEPITWRTFIEALRDSRLGQLADNLTDLLTHQDD